MAVKERGPASARSLAHALSEGRLPVDGVLPPELGGCFLQAVPHPAASLPPGGRQAAAGPCTFAGVRVEDGGARWFRGVLRAETLGPVPAIAPSVWLAGPGGPAMTVARPVREAGSPLWHTVACHPGLGYAEHVVVDPGGEILRATPFALDGAPLMHAMALTRRFVVVLDLPVCYDDAAALVGARFPYSWRARRPARIGLLLRRRRTAEPRWFAVDPCYVFHAANAYDEGDRVVLDATAYTRAFDAHGPAGPPCLRRWTLDLRSGAVRTRPLVPVPAPGLPPEAAIVDDRVYGRRHRYLFGATGAALSRLDLRTGTLRSWEFPAGLVPGRPVFVPRADDATEGAGWLVLAVEDPGRHRGDLMVFDALDLAGPPRATVSLPVALPPEGRTTWLGSARPGNDHAAWRTSFAEFF
ncbi:carotenoid oxygenase family protein [Actinomadura sp. DC4]|uniref:carotenoid oxygenase family protein n=1 Tax=Actinomadura sp. DC4 TaxID=3055069 RepID=UPI0025B18925|nr:carotenoid oxygenase family protein [Actinomadura sp. DC4]MDN3354741.1 carotenoid oxygenase family protein [Actinomadura sp. DC4]